VHVRFPSTLLIVSLVLGGAAAASAAAREISGAVVDDSGRALPRARVRAFDASGGEIAATFADDLPNLPDVDDGGAVHTNKFAWIEGLGKLFDRFAEQIVLCPDVQT